MHPYRESATPPSTLDGPIELVVRFGYLRWLKTVPSSYRMKLPMMGFWELCMAYL